MKEAVLGKPSKCMRPCCDTCNSYSVAALVWWDLAEQKWKQPSKKEDQGFCERCNEPVNFTMRKID